MVVPPKIDPAHLSIYMGTVEKSAQAYANLRHLGIRKEDARFLLPNACETRLVVTMSFAAWRHFCWLRAVDKAAQWEIRDVGQMILDILHTLGQGYPYGDRQGAFDDIWEAYQRMD